MEKHVFKKTIVTSLNTLIHKFVVEGTPEEAIFEHDLKKAGTAESLHYHDDWNMLMKAVKKIGNLEFAEYKGLQDYMKEYWENYVSIFMPIEKLYYKVVECIKFLNDE